MYVYIIHVHIDMLFVTHTCTHTCTHIAVDPMSLIQPIATHSQHGNARVQPIMIRKLAGILHMAHVFTYSCNTICTVYYMYIQYVHFACVIYLE